jgi:hypothetical protein
MKAIQPSISGKKAVKGTAVGKKAALASAHKRKPTKMAVARH